MKTIRMEEMTQPEIKAAIQEGFTTAVVGVGSTEQHGPHPPTMTDARIGGELAHRVALKPGDGVTGYTELFDLTRFLNEASASFGVTPEASGAHVGESETSIMMAFERELVATDKIAVGYLGPMGEKDFQIILDTGMPALTASGVLGDPRTASGERGGTCLERLTDFLVVQVGKRGAPRSHPP
jgi:creatinine amidohydrolase/Fe(II)-dependent formamide hydrolase-like protein